MNPLQILSEEHVNILKVVESIKKECAALETGKELDKEYFDKAIDFIINYADKFHHAKEEDILFVELNKDEVEMHCNPVNQMLHEHVLGRNFVQGLKEGLIGDDKSKVINNARGYAQLLQEHIYKEDNILFPMADQALSDNAKDLMIKNFEKAEEVRFESGAREKYISIASEFAEK